MTDERSMRDRMLAGDAYIADDPDLRRENLRAQTLTHRYNALDPADAEARRALLTDLLGAFGEGSTIRAPFHCDYGYRTTVGAGTFVNWGLVALDVGPITIGDAVQIGPGVQLLTATHPVEPGPRREGWEGSAPITIEDNVWLGGGVVVLPGVTIGRDSVVGAGSVVTRDVPPGVVVVGNPARVVRDITP